MQQKELKRSSDLLKIRESRIFSDSTKRDIVKEIVEKHATIQEICELHKVSRASVYKWIYKYSPVHAPGTKQVVQMESEAVKTQLLQQRVAELERVVGQKQLALDFWERLITLASNELGYDIKKNLSQAASSNIGSGSQFSLKDKP